MTGGRTHGRTRDLELHRAATFPSRGFDTWRLGVVERILTLSQLAAYLDVPRRRLYRLIGRHPRFPVFKNGRHWCADIHAVVEWLLQEYDTEEAKLSEKDGRRRANNCK